MSLIKHRVVAVAVAGLRLVVKFKRFMREMNCIVGLGIFIKSLICGFGVQEKKNLGPK